MAEVAWSSISSRTSRRSSTSDGLGLVRLTHPFPSLLNGLVAAAVAVVAGGGASTALRLGLGDGRAARSRSGRSTTCSTPSGMRGRTPPKPIPGRPVSSPAIAADRLGRIGGARTAPGGPVRAHDRWPWPSCGLSIGYGYDRFAKGTAWSWVPFALGIPLVPVYGWVGTGQPLPSAFAVLVPCAVLAGAALAIANASADFERDLAAGRRRWRSGWVLARCLAGAGWS